MIILWKLLWTFLQIGFFSIGGGYAIIPQIQDQVVREHAWITQQAFTDMITISQMTPGPLAVNTSTFVGIRIAGIPGAILATTGCVISGIFISLLLYTFFNRNRNSACIFEILKGLKAASVGLILSAAVTLLLLAFTGCTDTSLSSLRGATIDRYACILFAVSFFFLRKWKVNPTLLIVLTGIGGLFLYR